MSVDKTPTGVVYTVTNGAVGQQYPLTFPYIKGADVKAYYVQTGTQTSLTCGTHYTVVDQTFTASVALPVGAKLAIYRQTDLTQDTLWKDGQAVYTPDIMKADDKLTLIAQEIAADMSRTVKLTREEEAAGGKPEDVVASIYASRDAAAASASAASAQATAAEASAQAAAISADAAAQTVQTASAEAVAEATEQAQAAAISAMAAAQSAASAEGASSGLAPRMDMAEVAITQHDTRLDAVESGVTAIATTLIGSVQSVMATDTYVPNGCVPANGGEYTRAQFPSLFDDYLAGGKLLTCTYAVWAAQVAQTGNCAKFALDVDAQKFKVPLYKDGDSITQAASAAEQGRSYKAGLPNITGEVPGLRAGPASTFVGAFYLGNVGTDSAGGGGGLSSGKFDASRSNSIFGNSSTVTDEQVRLRHFVVVASAQNSASLFDWSAYMAALAGKANTDLSNATGNAIGYYFYAYDQKPSGTSGGTTSAATWMTRDVNTVVRNFIGASLSNNRIRLPAGRYFVVADVPAFAVNSYRASLYDVTHGAHLLYSPSCECNYGYGYTIPAHIEDEITLTVATDLEIRMYCEMGRSDGLGIAGGFGASLPERYTEVRIWKM